MAVEYSPVTEEEDDFDLNFNGAKMRSILIKSGLADTDVARVMQNVRMAQQIRMIHLQDEAKKLEKSTKDFNFVATVNHQQILDILHEADVPEKAILRSLSRLDELAKQATQFRQKVKNTIYWAVNFGKSAYCPPSDAHHHRHILLSNDKDPIPSEITVSGHYPHVVVVTKHWETALHILNKLKHNDVRIIYIEFVILERPHSHNEFTASPLVQEHHAIHEWANLGLQTSIENHVNVDLTHPKTRGVKGINMYRHPGAFDVSQPRHRKSMDRDNRYFTARSTADLPTRRPLLDNPSPHINSWMEPSQNNNRYGARVSPKENGGGMASYGFHEPVKERYSYDEYTSIDQSRESSAGRPSSRLDDFGALFTHEKQPFPRRDDYPNHVAQQNPYNALSSAKAHPYATPSINDCGYIAPPSFDSFICSQIGILGKYAGREAEKTKLPMPDYEIPKKTRAPGGMDLM